METNGGKSNVVSFIPKEKTSRNQSSQNMFIGNTVLDTSSQTSNILSSLNEVDNYTFTVAQGGVEFKAIVPLSINEIENSDLTLEEIAKKKYVTINPLFDPTIESVFTELGIEGENGHIETQ